MRIFQSAVLLTSVLMSASVASADVFDLSQTNIGGLCSGSCGTVTVTFNAGTIHFAINVAPNTVFGQGQGAFGFNVVGTNTGVQVTNIVNSSLFGFTGSSGNMDGFGSYEFLIDGPPAAQGASTLSFDVSRTGSAFTGLSDVYQTSSNGSGFFAAHVANGTGLTGFAVTGTTPRPPQGQVPEPTSVLLLGSVSGVVLYLMRKRLAV